MSHGDWGWQGREKRGLESPARDAVLPFFNLLNGACIAVDQ
jgi:hypothetical protein